MVGEAGGQGGAGRGRAGREGLKRGNKRVYDDFVCVDNPPPEKVVLSNGRVKKGVTYVPVVECCRASARAAVSQ